MKIHVLQLARAIAASLVICDHALLELSANDPASATTQLAWALGTAGVCGFFVISGFIMAHVSWQEFGTPGAPLRFLYRRLTRIVPLYWVATGIAFLYHKVSATHGAADGWRELSRSLAFIPYMAADGEWKPVLPQGWTLNYEMMFYCVFTLALLPKRALGLSVATFALLALTLAGPYSSLPKLQFLSSAIILWFAIGILFAVGWHAFRLSEPRWLARISAFAEPLGDASYSTYLVHGFVLTMLLRFWTSKLGSPSWPILPVSLVAANCAGYVVYRLVERPLVLFAHLHKSKAARHVDGRPDLPSASVDVRTS